MAVGIVIVVSCFDIQFLFYFSTESDENVSNSTDKEEEYIQFKT